MFRLPPLPAWEGMHPLLVHMPLGILAIAPLLVILAMLGGRWARGLSLAAMVVILAGTIGLVLAVSSGEATEKFADGVPGAGAILDQHEEGAELVRNVFFGVSVLAMIVFFVGGRLTGNRPDGTRRPRGAWIGANLLLKATKVDGVYDKDPEKHADAVKLDNLSYDDVIRRDLRVMDTAAFALCRDAGLPLRIFDMAQPGVLLRILRGEHIGTLVGGPG